MNEYDCRIISTSDDPHNTTYWHSTMRWRIPAEGYSQAVNTWVETWGADTLVARSLTETKLILAVQHVEGGDTFQFDITLAIQLKSRIRWIREPSSDSTSLVPPNLEIEEP